MKRILLSGLILIISLASAWTPLERVDRRPEGYWVQIPDLAVSRDGIPHISWREGPPLHYKIMYSRRSGDTWIIPMNVFRDSGELWRTRIVVDTAGVPLVLLGTQDVRPPKIKYSRLLGDTWSTPKLAFDRNSVPDDIIVDSLNRIHLLFGELGGLEKMWYSRYDSEGDSFWTPILVAQDSEDLEGGSLAADRDNNLHAVWMSFVTYGIDYSFYNGDSWTRHVHLPDSYPHRQSYYEKVAVDSLSVPHIVWEEGGAGIFYTTKRGDSWIGPERVSPPGANAFLPEICIDNRNRPNVVWTSSNPDSGVFHSVRIDTGWSAPEKITSYECWSSLVSSGEWLHLALWSLDPMHIYYTKSPSAGGVSESVSPAGWSRIWISSFCRQVPVRFTLNRAGPVQLAFVDAVGRRRFGLNLGILPPREHIVDINIRELPVGVYMIIINEADYPVVGRLIKIK